MCTYTSMRLGNREDTRPHTSYHDNDLTSSLDHANTTHFRTPSFLYLETLSNMKPWPRRREGWESDRFSDKARCSHGVGRFVLFDKPKPTSCGKGGMGITIRKTFANDPLFFLVAIQLRARPHSTNRKEMPEA